MAIGAKLKARVRVERENDRLLGGQKRGLPSAGQGRMSSYKAPSARTIMKGAAVSNPSVRNTVKETAKSAAKSVASGVPTMTPSVTRAYQEKIRKRKKEMNNMIKTAIDKRDYALPENRVGLRAKGRTISKTKWGK